MKPLLVMDFDGVWNPLNRKKVWIGDKPLNELSYFMSKPSDWEIRELPVDNTEYFAPDQTKTVVYDNRRQVTIQWSTELVSEVNLLIDSGKVEFLWLSTWRSETGTIIKPVLGLHSDVTAWIPPTQHSREDYFVSGHDYYQVGKVIALEEYLNSLPELRPVIWIEDVASYGFDNFTDKTNMKFQEKFSTPGLVIQTDGTYGLSRGEWGAVKQWVEQYG